MTKRTAAVLAAIVIALGTALAVVLLSGGSPGAGPAQCKAAMAKQFSYGMKHPEAPAGTRPAQCKGVSDKDVQRFAGEIISKYSDGAS